MTSALILSLILAAGHNHTQKPDPERALLEGVWRIVAVTENGEEVAEGKGQTLTFGKEKMFLDKGDGKVAEAVPYRMDSSKTPRQLDFEFTLFKTDWVPGIYRLDRDTLTLCFSSSDVGRPDKLDAGKGTDAILLKLERVKK